LTAQNAEISGLITDPSGLAVPHAGVVVQSADTGATRTVSSNQQGEYGVPALPPGPYNITVEAKRLSNPPSKWRRGGSGPAGTAEFRADDRQQRGKHHGAGERAAAQYLRCVGEYCDRQPLRGNLPLNGRSFSSLIDLTPGVVLTAADFQDQGQFG
jgi:hypothetical protein